MNLKKGGFMISVGNEQTNVLVTRSNGGIGGWGPAEGYLIKKWQDQRLAAGSIWSKAGA
jgi:hypothetical protein